MFRLIFIFLLIFGCSIHVGAQSTPEESLKEGKDFINGLMNGTTTGGVDLSKFDSNVDTSEVQKSVKVYTENPKEMDYMDNPHNMQNDAYIKQVTDENSKIASDLNSNPSIYRLDKNDPLMGNVRAVEANVSNLIANNYSGCANIPAKINSNNFTSKTCLASWTALGSAGFNCTATWTSTCTNPDYKKPLPYKISDFTIVSISPNSKNSPLGITTSNNLDFNIFNSTGRGGSKKSCQTYTEEVHFNVDEIGQIEQIGFNNIKYDDELIIELNGNQIFEGAGDHFFPNGQQYPCEQHGTHSYSTAINANGKIRQGKNVLRIYHEVGGVGGFSFNMTLKRIEPCRASEGYSRQCDPGTNPNLGIMQSKSCVDFTATTDRWGNSICAKYSESYQGNGQYRRFEEAECSNLRHQGCVDVQTKCLSKVGAQCVQEEITYRCDAMQPSTELVCGTTVRCLDAECTKDVGRTTEDATSDLNEALTKMQSVNESTKQFDSNDLTIFKGQSAQCFDSILNVTNCCSDSVDGTGIGNDLGLTQCTADEQNLIQARADKRTHYVGSDGSWNGDDRYFCIFTSKLSRILIEQGRSQLGKGWGSATSPDCSGFTPEEMERLDFDKMDLTEFYADIESKMGGKGTASTQLVEQLKNKLGSIGAAP